MLVDNPEDINAAFAAAYNSGDIENLMALYEPDAVVVSVGGPHAGHARVGLKAIRADLASLLAIGGIMESVNQYALRFDNIALMHAQWRIATDDASGEQMHISGSSMEVVRQQADGSWLYVIDHPTLTITRKISPAQREREAAS